MKSKKNSMKKKRKIQQTFTVDEEVSETLKIKSEKFKRSCSFMVNEILKQILADENKMSDLFPF